METEKITKIKRIEQVETDSDKICNGCIFKNNEHCELSGNFGNFGNLLEILRCVETVESINSPVVSEKQYIWVKDE